MTTLEAELLNALTDLTDSVAAMNAGEPVCVICATLGDENHDEECGFVAAQAAVAKAKGQA